MTGKVVGYTHDGLEMRGYLALPGGGRAPRPGILVVHEWWGLNEYPRRRADMLAELGYPALAVDLYGGGRTAANPDEAGTLMHALIDDMATLRARFLAAMACLGQQPGVDAGRAGAIGYCFGGGVVLHMARAGAPLDAVASFHGSLGLAIVPGGGPMRARVVAYNGEADTFISAETLRAFEAEMRAAGARWQLVQLPGALHGFSNPAATARGQKYGLPLRYDELADQASWSHMQLLFRDVFGAPA